MNRILRGLRIAYDYSLTEMAERLGVSQSYISKIESGESKPSEKLLKKYCDEFHITRNALSLFEIETNSNKNNNFQELLYRILTKICNLK